MVPYLVAESDRMTAVEMAHSTENWLAAYSVGYLGTYSVD